VKARVLAKVRAHPDVVRLWAASLAALAIGLLILSGTPARWVWALVGSVFLGIAAWLLFVAAAVAVQKRRRS
jgi:cell division protein FtsW (lipid II flippase)